MARRPSGTRRPGKSPSAEPAPAAADASAQPPRERMIAAFLGLLAEKPIENIGPSEIAAAADLTLADLRAEFSSTLGIYAAHVKNIDRQVLSGGGADLAEESPREKLFDVLMRRLDVLTPHKAAVRSLLRSARRSPPLALALNGLAVRSQQWMLTAADISASGPRGMLRAQGLAILFAQVLRVWLADDDPGLARTMAELDRGLGRGQRLVALLDDLCCLLPPRCPSLRRWRRRREDGDHADEVAAA